MMTLQCGASAVIRRAASTPFNPGMLMSMSAISKEVFSADWTAL
jgi:hypothetical protein